MVSIFNKSTMRVRSQRTSNCLSTKYYIIIQMKDRWKILIISLIISGVFAIIFLFLGFSFKEVGLREYGLLQYTFYQTVYEDQTVRSNGNYLVGLDHVFLAYPKQVLMHNFTVSALTKDKSIVKMDGLFLGQLIESEILNMHFNYGSQYFKIVGKSVEEIFRESLQSFLLTEIVSERSSVNSFVSSNVCLNVEAKYSFIDCQHVSTGVLTVNAKPLVLQTETTIQEYLKNILEKTIEVQKELNIYSNGGFELIQNIQSLNAALFLNTTNTIISTIANFTTEGKQIFAGSAYILNNPLLPLLNNQIQAINIK